MADSVRSIDEENMEEVIGSDTELGAQESVAASSSKTDIESSRKGSSLVWQFFARGSEGARCNFCSTVVCDFSLNNLRTRN
jgi:hypothetical protein